MLDKILVECVPPHKEEQSVLIFFIYWHVKDIFWRRKLWLNYD